MKAYKIPVGWVERSPNLNG